MSCLWLIFCLSRWLVVHCQLSRQSPGLDGMAAMGKCWICVVFVVVCSPASLLGWSDWLPDGKCWLLKYGRSPACCSAKSLGGILDMNGLVWWDVNTAMYPLSSLLGADSHDYIGSLTVNWVVGVCFSGSVSLWAGNHPGVQKLKYIMQKYCT